MAQQERFFLLDGMALAYRAYFSFIARPLLNSRGENTSAIYGFVTTLMKILEEEKPDHIAVAMDTKEPTFRHTRYPEYKATRQKMPEDMASQLEKLKEVVRAFKTPLIELPGYEADDIIGTLARRAEKEGVETLLVTADKDFMQLISPLIKMYRPGKAGGEVEIVGEDGVKEKFGVAPEQVIEVLGLIGDKSDNVPGVPGIGEKTAIPLVQKYGSIAELYRHLDEIPQKGVREKLIQHKETALLSRELVTIETNVPLTIDFHQLRATPPNAEALAALFADLEFRSLAGRFRNMLKSPADASPRVGTEVAAVSPPTPDGPVTDITSDPHTHHCITTKTALTDLRKRLEKAALFSFDTETTSTDALQARLVGLSFCISEREAYYVPVRSATAGVQEDGGLFGENAEQTGRQNHTLEALDQEVVLGSLKKVLENGTIRKVAQNAKYDMLVLRQHGIEVHGLLHDTMVAGYVLRPDGQHNLDALALEGLGYKMVSFEELVGKGKNQKHITEVPLTAIAAYSAEDADMTMRIFRRQEPLLREHKLDQLCRDVEFPLIEVLTSMEHTGVGLDVPYLAGMSKDLERQLEILITGIHALAGEKFNINSTQQLGEILFNKLHLPPVRKTKTGYSTDVAVLETLRMQHPIVEKLLEYRQLTKLKSTYVDALPSLVNPSTGRVHTSFNQAVAATGRLSSSDPNLQNIPIRTEIGRAIRKAFIPGTRDHRILSADYSQIELRIMAHVSGDEALVTAFANDEDIHASTAARVFGVPLKDVSRDMRRKAKEVNFGIMYGIGPFGLANRLDISQAEARDIIARYFERFPRVKEYISTTTAGCRANGYVSTLLGRRRYLPDVNSKNQTIKNNAERQAINMPIQGTAADMIKLAMIGVFREITKRRLQSRMILQVHDELVLEVPQSEIEVACILVVEQMQKALPLRVPVKVDVGTGMNWLEAH
jgi:DNA polymerase I